MAGERWVDIAEETAYGTENATALASLSYIDLDASPDQGKILDFESESRLKREAIMGPFIGNGSLSLFARPELLGYFLKWVLGAVSSTQIGTGAMYLHSFTSDPDSLKSFSLTDCRELPADKARCLVSCLTKSLTLEAPARGKVTAELDLQYQWEKIVTKPAIGTIETNRPFVFHDGVVKLDDVALANVEAVKLVLGNTIPDDTHELGSRKLPEIYIEGLEWTVEMDLKFKDWSARQKFYGGTGTETEPALEDKLFDIDLEFTGEPTGDLDEPNYKLFVYLPACTIKENPTPTSRRDRLTQRLVFEALFNAGNKIELSNKITSY